MKKIILISLMLILFSSIAFAGKSYDLVPVTNTANNIYIQDVVGNKNDTTSGDSIVALIKSITTNVAAIAAPTNVILIRGTLVTNTNTLTGNGAQSNNLFVVSGSVEVLELFVHITNIIDITDLADVSFEGWDGTASVEITDRDSPLDASGAGIGSIIQKTGAASTVAATLNDSTTVAISEKTLPNFELTGKVGETTYIRIMYNGDGSTDVSIIAYIRYRQITQGATIIVAP